MFTRILIPLDGSEVAEQTLRYVRWLSRELAAPIELLRVVEPIPRELKDVTDSSSLEKVESDLRTKSRDYLESVGGSLREDGLQVSHTVLEGQPAFQIVGLARKAAGTLIVMSTNGRTGTDWWLLGSVTDKVVRAATTPVLIIRPPSDAGISEGAVLNSVLVPLDGSEVAEGVLPYVVNFAKPLGLAVTLIRITPEPGAFFGYLHDSASVTEEMSLRVDAQAGEYLAGVGEKLRSQGIRSVEERVLHGDPATAILEAADEMQDVAVAMATHGMSGPGSWSLGAVTSRVVRYSTGPTLVVSADEEDSLLS